MPSDQSPIPTALDNIDCPIEPIDCTLLSRLEASCQIALYSYSHHPVVTKIRSQSAASGTVVACPIALLRSPLEEHKRFTSHLLAAQP
jgi:hypothetical protein